MIPGWPTISYCYSRNAITLRPKAWKVSDGIIYFRFEPLIFGESSFIVLDTISSSIARGRSLLCTVS